ncbi:hypothetical protein [Hymenobacter canadensis]|uniref:Uncharacterized protein n=1 Tax=Hymenobacter canadensis TaxID=2999067 RepID=A0ABY7LUI1_9BACT|nr:hypothetical protein [Hymenobacter canadensis]WBA44057.1 hypothetical protein O3303_21095 [Hymenobacter canadensis]
MKTTLLPLLLLLPCALFAQQADSTVATVRKPASLTQNTVPEPDSEAIKLKTAAQKTKAVLLKDQTRQSQATAQVAQEIVDGKTTAENTTTTALIGRNKVALTNLDQVISLADAVIDKADAADAAAKKAKADLAKVGKDPSEKEKKKINQPAQDKLQAAKDANEKLSAALIALGAEKKEEAKAAKEFSPFRLWIGTNFDMLEKIKATKLYGNLDFTLPMVDDKREYLLQVGAFQNRSISVDSARRSGTAVDRDFRAPIARDTIQLLRTTYDNKVTTSINNLGFYVTSGIKILSKGNSFKVEGLSSTVKNLNGYLALRAEIVRRQYSTVNKVDVLRQDTIRVPFDGTARFFPLPPDRTFSRVASTFQVGAPFIFVTDNIEMRFAPYVGVVLPKSWTVSGGYLSQRHEPKTHPSPLYCCLQSRSSVSRPDGAAPAG